MIRNHNNNSLSTPPQPLRYGTSKSSESDLSTCTLSGSRLPLPHSPRRPTTSPGGVRSAYSRLVRPHTSHFRPPTPDSPNHAGLSSSPAHGPTGLGGGLGGYGGGELVPVVLSKCERDSGLGFSVTAGGLEGSVTVVERVWDRRQCHSLQPGDAIVKINGADVQSLSCVQVQSSSNGIWF